MPSYIFKPRISNSINIDSPFFSKEIIGFQFDFDLSSTDYKMNVIHQITRVKFFYHYLIICRFKKFTELFWFSFLFLLHRLLQHATREISKASIKAITNGEKVQAYFNLQKIQLSQFRLQVPAIYIQHFWKMSIISFRNRWLMDMGRI